MIGWLVVAVLLVASPSWAACTAGPGANTWTALNPTYGEVNDCVLNAASGDTIYVPAGSATWGIGQTLSPATKYLSIIGAGDENTELTIITNGTGGQELIDWNTIEGDPGAANGGLSRISGFSFIGGTTGGATPDLSISGVSSRIRFDHNKVWKRYQTSLIINGYARGVADNNIFDATNVIFGSAMIAYVRHYHWNVPGSYHGDASWAAPDSYGTADAFYFEDNIFRRNVVGATSCTIFTGDGEYGSRMVSRFNHYQNVIHSSGHCTESSQRDRCRRSMESYENWIDMDFTGCTGTKTISVMVSGRLATMLMHNNRITLAGGASGGNYDMDYARADNDFPPWGSCGRKTITSLTRSGTTATVTTATNHGFDTPTYGSDPSNRIHVRIAGVTPSAYNGIWPLASVISTTEMTFTLPSDPGAWVSGGYTSSPWDADTNAVGGPCIDQAGRGQDAAMMPDDNVPYLASTGKPGWTNQAFSPGFYLNNKRNGVIVAPQNSAPAGYIVFDRDVWAGTFGEQTSADGCATSCLPFNGTTGVGQGRFERRPTTCTTGVIYKATNQGTWNTATVTSASGSPPVTPGSSGKFYRCQSTNSWAAWYGTNNIYGEPYLYPHPLITGNDPVPPPPTPSAPTGFEIIP